MVVCNTVRHQGRLSSGIWFHSHRGDITRRIYELTEEQTARLLDFLEKGQAEGSTCPLPIFGDASNRRRVDEDVAMPEFNVYRDRWERTVDYRNWEKYTGTWTCTSGKNAVDWPEVLDQR